LYDKEMKRRVESVALTKRSGEDMNRSFPTAALFVVKAGVEKRKGASGLTKVRQTAPPFPAWFSPNGAVQDVKEDEDSDH
jgi:hypothetical protein